jgi:ectoine hydroxylase-related dioxygenase (phytanoyl-CoA dioxygenase family)
MAPDTSAVADRVDDDMRAAWREHGVVFLPQALDHDWVERLATEHGRHIKDGGQMWRWREFPEYLRAAQESVIPDLVRALWQTDDVWFLYDQVFQKSGGYTARTPWHQDLSYLAIEGEDLAVVWITFDPVLAEESLEFVRGSHRGTLYNGYSYDPKKIAEDETTPLFRSDKLPRLPAIQKARDQWDIVSWQITPGDLVIFHPGLLHGGAPVLESTRRRTLSLRFFGSDAVYSERPARVGPPIPELHEALKPGDPFRWTDDWFPKVR